MAKGNPNTGDTCYYGFLQEVGDVSDLRMESEGQLFSACVSQHDIGIPLICVPTVTIY